MNATTLNAPKAQVPNLRTLAMRAISAAFSPNASLIAACAVAALMYFHFMTIADAIEAQRAVAIDCLYGLPWGIAFLIRSIKKGGAR